MALITAGLFTVLWSAIGFFVSRLLLERVFSDKRAASISAALIVIAFVAGYYCPFSERSQQQAGTVPAPASAPPVAPAASVPNAAVSKGPDESARCRNAKGSIAATSMGYSDVLQTRTGMSTRPIQKSGDSFDRSDKLEMTGWAGADNGAAPAVATCLFVDGRIEPGAKSHFGLDRADVVASVKNDALLHSGFLLEIPPNTLSAGTHRISIVSISPNGSLARVSGDWVVDVK